MTTRRELREDLQASVAARRELGPEYEAELLDAFLERVDRRIDAHVAHRVGSRSLQPPRRESSFSATALALGSMGFGVPLSAIAGGVADLPGLLVAWTGIVGVNVAAAWGRRSSGSSS